MWVAAMIMLIPHLYAYEVNKQALPLKALDNMPWLQGQRVREPEGMVPSWATGRLGMLGDHTELKG